MSTELIFQYVLNKFNDPIAYFVVDAVAFMVSVLDSRSSGPGSSAGQGYCVVLLG